MILVKAAAGLVIELGPGESGRLDCLSVRLAEGLAGRPIRFEVQPGATGQLLARPLEPCPPAELIVALAALLANEDKILAEVCKYR
jgi:hypothetical protein